MSFYEKKFNSDDAMLRAVSLCDWAMFEESINNGANVNYRNSKALYSIMHGSCNNKDKEKIVDLLLDKEINLEGLNTLLSLAILNGDEQIISFCLAKIKNPYNEGLSLIYALEKNDCSTVSKLLNLGVKLSDETLEYVQGTLNENISSACNDLHNVQNLDISVNSSAIFSNIVSLEENILLGHHLCTEFFTHS